MANIEELKDIEGSTHLELEYGERFRGWYFSKIIKESQVLPLNYKGLTYSFKICDYNYRFIMPPKIEFKNGLICYSTGDRLLGVFRFPRDPDGEFVAPIHLKPIDAAVNLSKEEAERALSMKEPLVFEVYKIPQFGFEFIDIDDKDMQGIENITDKDFSEKIKEEFNSFLQNKINEVLDKIRSSRNYLLILANVLDKKLKNLNEIAEMSNQIIHI